MVSVIKKEDKPPRLGLSSWLLQKTQKKINQSNNYRQITVAKIVIKHFSHILIKDLLGKSKESIKESHAHLFFLHLTRQA